MCLPDETLQLHSFAHGTANAGENGPPPECVPLDPMCVAAHRFAQTNLPVAIVNHALRVFIYAKTLAERDDTQWLSPSKLRILFVACMLHDVGCASRLNGPERFEVEGADAADSLLRDFNVPDTAAHDVWQAIALHTSPGIAERIGPLPRLLRLAVLIDFGQRIDVDVRDTTENMLPRLDIEKVLGDTVVEQALKERGKAPAASWPGILVRAKLENPEWDGVNMAF